MTSKSKRQFVYHPEVDMLENSRQVRALTRSIEKKYQVRPHPAVNKSITIDNQQQSTPKRHVTIHEYNKWYIDPNMRYMKKEQNPKSNYRAYEREDYVYKNLHNNGFWNWVHPFDKKPRQALGSQAQADIKSKINVKILQEFKKKLDDSHIRLPIIVKEVLGSKN